MPGPRIDELVRLAAVAFATDDNHGWSHGLLDNLHSVSPQQWRALPPGGSRTIEAIALHAGATKAMYDDHAFGAASLTWDDPAVAPWPPGEAPVAAVLPWLEEVHRRFIDHVAALDDAELERPRRANWGTDEPTRWLVATVIGHDMYHAGEVNHLRSILEDDDRWAFEREG